MPQVPPKMRTVADRSCAGAIVLFCLPVMIAGAAFGQGSARSASPVVPKWRLADSDCGARLIAQPPAAGDARRGAASETVQLVAGQGSYAYLVRPLPPARVIAELSPGVWIKSDRSGLQLLARVVLPRTPDPRTGAPMTTLIGGAMYQDAGNWQLLSIENAALLLERQQRVLRAQYGPDIDIREAYVDLLVINGYGGVGTTTISIGEIRTTGTVAPPAAPRTPPTAQPPLRGDRPSADPLRASAASGERLSAPRLHGSVLVADGRPLLVQGVQHHGEPFEWLRSLGFNAVVLARPPNAEQLREAEQTGMWLVAPPPQIDQGGRITAAHARVLAWDLGRGLETADQEHTRQLAEEVHRGDPVAGRPLLCGPLSGVWQYSRLADVLLVRRDPLGTSFDLSDYGDWLDERMRLARPGTPLWATVQTEYAPQMVEQWATLAGDKAAQIPVDPRQVRMLTYAAIAAGARGVVFVSNGRLDGSSPRDQMRAANLKLVNQRLRLLEPWAAGGERLSDVEASADTVDVSVLQTERSRVLLLLNETPQQQHVLAPAEQGGVSLLSGSAPSSAQVYRIAAGDLEPLTHQRVTGGLRMTLDDSGLCSLVVVSQEPLVINHFKRFLAEQRESTAELEYEVSSQWKAVVEGVYKQLAAAGKAFPQAPALLSDADANLRRSSDVLAARDFRSGQLFAERAATSLTRLRRGVWEQTVSVFPDPIASPFCATFETLPWHWALAERLSAATWTGNVLAGGDMEQLDHMLRSGWRRHLRDPSPVDSAVELSPPAARSGGNGLSLRVFQAEGEAEVAVLEAPRLWITSPDVAVRRGQVVRVHGWVQLPQSLEAGRDGLLVYDSLGGIALAERITQSGGWREFTLYRVAPRDGRVQLTFALSGIGEAWIDDVSVQLAMPPGGAMSSLPSPFR